jgi:hypothetical protein
MSCCCCLLASKFVMCGSARLSCVEEGLIDVLLLLLVVLFTRPERHGHSAEVTRRRWEIGRCQVG